MIKIVNSHIAYRGRLFSVRCDLLQINDKQITREIVEHPGAIVVIPIDNTGDIYLVKQYRHAVGAELIEVPAGTIENETPEACAARELEEETGLKASVFEKLAEFYLAPGYSTELIHLFIARGLTEAEASYDVDEKITLLKVSLKDALKMVLNREIKDAKTIVSLLLFREVYGLF